MTLCCFKRLLNTHHILSNHRFLDESESSTCNRKRNTTIVVMMQSITIDINFEQFLWHSSELGIKGKGVKYGHSKCVFPGTVTKVSKFIKRLT